MGLARNEQVQPPCELEDSCDEGAVQPQMTSCKCSMRSCELPGLEPLGDVWMTLRTSSGRKTMEGGILRSGGDDWWCLLIWSDEAMPFDCSHWMALP